MKTVFYAIIISIACIAAGCSQKSFKAYHFDNGDDYFCEGLQRIVDDNGRIGFADSTGKVVITPQFAFAFPFADGVARATMTGKSVSDGEHSWWESQEWFYVDRNGTRVSELETALRDYISNKDARIGIAVIYDGKDTIAVRGDDRFPMLSVYKFPQALAVADFCRRNNIAFNDSVEITADEIKTDTWSPLREKYGQCDIRLSVAELLAFTLQQSDNNACDILFRLTGGPAEADSLMKATGYPEITIISTEDDMHRDTRLCYDNSSTPKAMARLADVFNTNIRLLGDEYAEIARLMETCATGTDRIARPLAGTGAVTGHKTGTSDTDSQGRIIAVNDAGYVNLPDGHRYSIAVFISDSSSDMGTTSAMIAEISEMVLNNLRHNTNARD